MHQLSSFTNPFSEEIWANTYKDKTDACLEDTFHRVATAISSVEKTDELKREWENKFFDLLSEFKVVAGGRIISNAGTQYKGTTLLNCFTGPKPKYDQDSLEGIFQVLFQQAKTLKSEGGWGMNFSFIRPRGSFINGIGVETPGSVKYMELFDKSSEIITSGSGINLSKGKGKEKIRKGAQISILSCWHPDVEEFITAKLQSNRLSKFNLSVDCSNEFMDKVAEIDKFKKAGKEIPDKLNKWELIFPDTTFEKYKSEWDGNIDSWKSKGYPIVIYKTITVEYLWNLIIESTYKRNEPGILFFDRANETHCWNYAGSKSYIRSTNPCGEQYLVFGGCCDLGSVNITQFYDFKNKKFNFEKLSYYIKIAVRFLDNVNDYAYFPLDEYKEMATKSRRIGLGVMGWGSLLYLMKIRFGSDEAEDLKKKIMRVFTNSAVDASINLAIEKGAFEYCDPKKHSEALFWRKINLDENLINKIKKYGIRNSALFSIQPTGNTSIFANIVSGGVEPIFDQEYIRTVIIQNPSEELKSKCPKYWEGEFEENNWFKYEKEGDEKILRYKSADGIIYKIDKNRGLTKEVICEDYSVKILKQSNEWDRKAHWAVTATSLTAEEHLKDLNGWSKFIDSSISKTLNFSKNYPFDKFKDVYLNAYKSGTIKGITTYREGTMTSVLSSSIEKKEETQELCIKRTHAPKRPKELNAHIHHFVLKGVRYYVAVGFISKYDVYEVFTGINCNSEGDPVIPKNIKDGKIVKISRGNYEFKSGNEFYKLTNGHNDETADALTRIISSSLRHGCDISVIVGQLEKTHGPMISFSKILARTLKYYIKDGTEVHGEVCDSCGSTKLIRKEGCISCQCGWSRCS